MGVTLSDVTSAVSALESSLASVHGDDGSHTRFYAPMSLGAFADVLDDLTNSGWVVDRISTAHAHVHDVRDVHNDDAATYNIAVDEDQTVAQLLQGKEAWAAIEHVLKAHIDGDDVGADVAPSDDASAESKLDWLKGQADKVATAATQYRDKAYDLGKEEAQAVKQAGKTAVQTITKTAQGLKRGAEKKVRALADDVINTVKGAAVTAGWTAGIGLGAIAIVAVIIYASAKSGATQRRSNRLRGDFTRGARDAGVM